MATAREIQVASMLRLEEAGYPLIMEVYDEVVAEVPDGFGSVEEFGEIMKISAGEWMDNWPISVDVWDGLWYKK